MHLEQIIELCEELRIRAIGNPEWIKEKNVYEFSSHTVEVVAILKLMRATHGMFAMLELCGKGLFIDQSTIYRSVFDCTAEIHFLLEAYPEKSKKVDQFITGFFQQTIDSYHKPTTEHVPSKKIRSAMVRVLTGKQTASEVSEMASGLYEAFSGYTHAGYCHIMQMYGGPSQSFNLSGIPADSEKQFHMQWVQEAYLSVVHAIGFIAQKFGYPDIAQKAINLSEQDASGNPDKPGS